MATSAPIPPTIRAAATRARVDKLAAALLFDELMVCVGSAVLSVPVELVLVVGVELVGFVLVGLVVGVVEIVGVITVEVVGVVKVVEVVVGFKESDVVSGKGVLGKVRVFEVVPKSVGEGDTALVANPNGEGDNSPHSEHGFQGDQTCLPGSPVSQPLFVTPLRTNVVAGERMAYMEHSGTAALVHGATAHEGSICARELGIYKGKDKRATNVIKEPGAVSLKVSMLPVQYRNPLMVVVVKTSGAQWKKRLYIVAMRVGFSSPQAW
jgi:hypothetical protein